ncbi:M60 family metallopeptidase [Streptomyces sp. NPDC051940]|uniref:M60 family metallopeptidase n=1 Tax=Streptomyces sp. NPDC051940 TaxID=3155675 RepID=UPI003441C5D2
MRTSPLSRRTALTALAGTGAATLLATGSAHATTASATTAATASATVDATAFAAGEPERLRLAAALRGSDFIPTGHYAPPGRRIQVVVTPLDGVLPTLHIGTYDYYHLDPAQRSPRTYQLTAGLNTVTDPYGGPVYLRLAGDGERAAVSFASGAERMAAFELGRTPEGAFQDQLDARTSSPYVELLSPYAIITVTREAALLYRDQDHTELMNLVERLVATEAEVSGLDGSRPLHARKAGRYHFIEVTRVPSGVGAYATHGFNGFPRAYLDRLVTVEGVRDRGWGFYHELGHLHQQFAYKPAALTEVTVNIYSLACQRAFGQRSNLLTVNATTGLNWYQTALPKLGAEGLDFERAFGAYEKLVSLRQLELAFGTRIWPELHRLIRLENPQSDWATQNHLRYRAFGTYLSRVTGHDLTDFLTRRWAYPIDAAGIAEMAALGLPQPPVDPSTLTE